MLQVLVPSASALGRSRPFNIFSPTLPILPSLTNRASFRCSHKRLRLISHASKEGGDDIDPIDEPSKTDIQWSSGWLGTFYQIEEAARVFLVALFWIVLFFGASAWDGTKSGRRNKRDSQRRR
ncbi:uncharacterized protein LOC131077761 [Cryptomeria japonica]|uniref:uncharacterized protein LOC131077761 n=1 Tax=Cryptomeria japonica TaxID=3369 RepID=UPI0027DA14A6|nr:uncharacterized protein LOC131077761 [Cryptomeria japonica]